MQQGTFDGNLIGDGRNRNSLPEEEGLYELVEFTDEKIWEFPRENLTVIRMLGSGNFGEVHKGIAYTMAQRLGSMPIGIPVAVKILKGNGRMVDGVRYHT